MNASGPSQPWLGHSRGGQLESLTRSFLPKVFYGALFVVVLPLALVLWAYRAKDAAHFAVVHSVFWGAMLTALGVAVLVTGMMSLWRFGRGLPMNAFPPSRFVENGIYSLVPHPIYGGFVIACAGIAFVCGSVSGLWLVTPVVVLSSAALVVGYEMPDLRKRFGAPRFSLWLPMDRLDASSLLERFRVYMTVLLPWLALYELTWHLGKASDAAATYLPFESRLPVMERTEVIVRQHLSRRAAGSSAHCLWSCSEALRTARADCHGAHLSALFVTAILRSAAPFYLGSSHRPIAVMGEDALFGHRSLPVFSYCLGTDSCFRAE